MTKPVVFFPGTFCDERLWMQTWRKLNIQDRRYVPLQWANTLDEMLSITQHAIGGDKVHVVGFSMGGYIASLAATQWPQHIASLTLISFASEGLTDQEVKQRQSIISAIKNKRYQGMSDNRLAIFLSKPTNDSSKQKVREQAAETMKSMESDLGPSVLKYHIEATTPRPSITHQLKKLTCPIHVISGADDALVSTNSLKEMKSALKKAKFTQLANCGHMLPLENAEEISQLISELTSS